MRNQRITKLLLWQIPLFAGLVLLWMLLWGEFSWWDLTFGALLSIVVIAVFYLPPISLFTRINFFWLGVFLVRLVGDIAIASSEVAFMAFNFRRKYHGAVIMIDLYTRSDFIMAITAEIISIVPGSYVVEADRDEHKLYLHVIGAETPEAIERARKSALKKERIITLAFGSEEDVQRMRREKARYLSNKRKAAKHKAALADSVEGLEGES